jgi:3'-5' exoribonuclease 1
MMSTTNSYTPHTQHTDRLGPSFSTSSRNHPSIYLVIDFEATCEENVPDFPHEIIEFPCVAVCATTHTILGEFQTYVKPIITSKLSPFCTKLTGISQKDVGSAPHIQDAVDMFSRWVEHEMGFSPHDVAVVTDGPWDIDKFLQLHITRDGVIVPRYFRRWVNMRKTFKEFYGIQRTGNLRNMLKTCGLQFQGRAHSGLTDARNIAQLMIAMRLQGCPIRVNDAISLPQGPRVVGKAAAEVERGHPVTTAAPPRKPVKVTA